MLEYHAHVAVLRGLRATIGAAFSSDPGLSAKVADLCATVDVDPDAAVMPPVPIIGETTSRVRLV